MRRVASGWVGWLERQGGGGGDGGDCEGARWGNVNCLKSLPLV